MMNRVNILSLTALTALGLAALPGSAFAQEKQHVSFKTAAENSKPTQQLNIDAGDVPNHIVRVFEVHRTYPNNPPVIDGLRLVEVWNRGYLDLTGGYGGGTSYNVYVMANGDKFFTRNISVTQTTSNLNSNTQVGFITGGTGKLAGMQGIVRLSSIFDTTGKTGFNESQTDIDYWMKK
ncbi:MAG TPA: hypothetical protein VHE81_11060 [Lacipirellulaceae bacterium]|nr:hypothetical protein [Lacipirellulaceae bacterium]